MVDFHSIVYSQKSYFDQRETFDIGYRRRQLKTLRRAITGFREEIDAALWSDLHKGPFEGHVSEIGIVLEEIDWQLRRLPRLAKLRRVPTPLYLLPARSYVQREPHGTCLIISPWNYPVQLSLTPLVAAIAAGNTAVLKLSDRSPAVSKTIADLLGSIFPERYVASIIAGPKQSAALPALPFDMIFFTGSPAVGKIIYKAAAEKMIPVVLELGGKNPCIVLEDAHLETAARRIVWGKFFNAGQTCVAPDYLVVHEAVRERLIAKMRVCITSFYGSDPKSSPDYGRLIDAVHVERTATLMGHRRHELEVDISENYIAPAIVENIDWDHPLMAEEIFGPILPVLSFTDTNELLRQISQIPSPLAGYVFSKNHRAAAALFDRLPCGCGCINDTIVQFGSTYLPVGGTGASGIGRYHGDAGFEAFSRPKTRLVTPIFPAINLRFPPYRLLNLKIARKLMG